MSIAGVQPWVVIEKAVCFEIWQADMERLIYRLDKPYRLDEQSLAQAEAKLSAAAPELAKAGRALLERADRFAMESCEPIFMEEREALRVALAEAGAI
jgi:hypothetical protein